MCFREVPIRNPMPQAHRPPMKSTLLIVIFVFQFLLVAHSHAQYQDEERVGLSNTLSLGGVAKALKMTDDQQFNLADTWLMVQIDLRNAFQEYQSNYAENLPESEQQRLRDTLNDAITKIRDLEIQRLEAVLKPDQIERLKQIRFQYLRRTGKGLEAIKDELELSDDQLMKIEKVAKELKEEALRFQASTREINLPPAELTHHLGQIRRNAEERLLSILSPSQRQKLRRLEGESFEFQFGPPEPGDDNGEEDIQESNDENEPDKT